MTRFDLISFDNDAKKSDEVAWLRKFLNLSKTASLIIDFTKFKPETYTTQNQAFIKYYFRYPFEIGQFICETDFQNAQV